MLSETTFLVLLIALMLAIGFSTMVSEYQVVLQMVDYEKPPKTVARYRMCYPSILNRLLFLRRFRVIKGKCMTDHNAERWYVTDCYRDDSPLKITGRDTYFVEFNHGRERIAMEAPDDHWLAAWGHVAHRLSRQFNIDITIPHAVNMANPRLAFISIEERRELSGLE
jgi:hypothetical protein